MAIIGSTAGKRAEAFLGRAALSTTTGMAEARDVVTLKDLRQIEHAQTPHAAVWPLTSTRFGPAGSPDKFTGHSRI